MSEHSSFDILPIPPSCALVVDAAFLASECHIIYGLVEADITVMKERRLHIQEETGEKLSFTACLVACLARAVAADPRVCKMVLFHDVDVVTMIELTERSSGDSSWDLTTANKLSVMQISDEI